MAKCGCGHSPENCTCKPSCKCGCNVRKSLAFERHAAYMHQAWRTLEDSVLLKILPEPALSNHKASGCTGCRMCSKQHQNIRKPRIPQVENPSGATSRVPNKRTDSGGPTHMSNVAPLSEKERAAQRKMLAEMAARAERALMQSKIRELSGGGTEEQPGDDSMVSTVPRPPQDWWDTFAADIDPGQ